MKLSAPTVRMELLVEGERVVPEATSRLPVSVPEPSRVCPPGGVLESVRVDEFSPLTFRVAPESMLMDGELLMGLLEPGAVRLSVPALTVVAPV